MVHTRSNTFINLIQVLRNTLFKSPHLHTHTHNAFYYLLTLHLAFLYACKNILSISGSGGGSTSCPKTLQEGAGNQTLSPPTRRPAFYFY